MSKIDEMIRELCPEGVGRVKLGDILDYRQPGPYIVKSTSYDDSYATPVLTAGQSFILGFTNETSSIYSASKDDPCIIFDDFTTGFHWVDFSFKVKSSAMKMLFLKSNNALLRYAYYAMTCIGFIPVEHSRHWISLYSQFEIPLPPLSIQQEIVSVLDSFTTLIDKMKHEVEKRKKQMEYYREKLLTFEDGECEWLQVQDICKNICSGGTPSTKNKEFYNGEIPWLRTQEVDWNVVEDTDVHISNEAVRNSSAKLIPAYCVIIAMYGATAAKACINAIPLTTNQACCNLEIDAAKALYKYVYYFFCNEYEELKAMGEGSQYNINGQKIKNYKIPVPALSKQAEIVSILDKFESYISKLERMIAIRQKQYEYYREQLLTFE